MSGGRWCDNVRRRRVVLTAGVWKGFDYTAMVLRVSETLEQPPVIVNAYDSLPEADPTDLPAIATAPSGPGEAPVRWIYYTWSVCWTPLGSEVVPGPFIR